MPDHRKHRGPHPKDAALFAPEHHPALRQAVTDLSWLLTRDYAPKSSLKLVGDRHSLTARQRQAVSRCACSDDAAARRHVKETLPAALSGRDLYIDGFNVLTTLETALSGGPIFPARDQCYRDIAGIHGNDRVLEDREFTSEVSIANAIDKPPPALELIQRELEALGVRRAHWFFDQSVSNSGRLKTLLADTIEAIGAPPADIQLVPDPDPILAATTEIIATSDSAILDACQAWFNLARHLIRRHVPDARVIPMDPAIPLP